MKKSAFRLLLAAVVNGLLASACGHGRTYVLFAATAREDKDMERVMTLRLPLWNQPPGATLFCQYGGIRMSVTRYDDTRVRLRGFDGSEQIVDVPDEDGLPTGLATWWPHGVVAQRCGLDPSSPFGSHAYVQWGTTTMRMERTDPEYVTYHAGGKNLRLRFPLTDWDRSILQSHAVPAEIVQLLY